MAEKTVDTVDKQILVPEGLAAQTSTALSLGPFPPPFLPPSHSPSSPSFSDPPHYSSLSPFLLSFLLPLLPPISFFPPPFFTASNKLCGVSSST